jgi:exonuclease VII small subunit
MQADVRSLDGIRDWCAAVKTYREDCAASLAGIEMEIRRAVDWVDDQGRRWASAVRDCEQELWQAKQDLNARKIPDWSGREPDTTVQERAVRRCEARLEHAQDQVRRCRSWMQKLPKLIDETYRANSHRLNLILEGDLAKALASLERRIASLEAYAGERPDFAPGPISQ